MKRRNLKRAPAKSLPRAYAFTAVVKQDEDGLFVATCPALQGCHTQAKTYDGAIKNIRDAIRLTLEMMKESGDPLPQDLGAERIIVMMPA